MVIVANVCINKIYNIRQIEMHGLDFLDASYIYMRIC